MSAIYSENVTPRFAEYEFSLLHPRLPSRTLAHTVSSELIGFCFSFFEIFLCRAQTLR